MRKLLLVAVAAVFLVGASVRADIIGTENEELDDGTPDGWSGVPVFNGEDYALPPGQSVNSIDYYASDGRFDTVDAGIHHATFLIAQLDIPDDTFATIWAVGPTVTPEETGLNSVEWGSDPIPDDGLHYVPAFVQWHEDGDNSNGGLIPFGGENGLGMFYFDVDGNDYVPEVGEDLTSGHASGLGGRDYQFHYHTGPPIDNENPALQAGDADQDLDFDQLDLVQVQIAGTYLSGGSATWGGGDWDGAPGGKQGEPPAGDGAFNQLDIIAALNADVYLKGPYAAILKGGSEGDGQTSIVYDPATGELGVDAPSGTNLTSVNITSAGSMFIGDKPAALDGAFDNFAADNIFKATFGGDFGSLSFGNVLAAGIDEDTVANDLAVVGSLAGGGDLGEVDLVYLPEPSSLMLLLLGFTALLRVARRR